MIKLVLNFITPINVLIFIFLSAAAGYWIFIRLKKRLKLSFFPVIALNTVLFLTWAITGRFYHDEAVHLHLSWLISKGLVPYKDFWFHHSPFLWTILAPWVSLFEHNPWGFELARLFALSVLAVNVFLGWKIAKKVWGKNASLQIYLLVLSSISILSQLETLRPDIFMTFFMLAGIYVTLDIADGKVYPSFWAGVSFGLAASFLIKQYLLYSLAFIAIFSGKEKRFLKLAAYILGFSLGIFPLASYLFSKNIISDFISWVFVFNKTIVVLLITFPLVVALLGGWGAYILFKRSRKSDDVKATIIFWAFCLSALSSLTTTKYAKGGYYLSFWFFVCAITASGCNIDGLFARIPSLFKRSLTVGILFAVLLLPNVHEALFSGKNTFFRDKKVVEQLRKYTGGETCVAVVPLHPIFARDATRFFSFSQYLFCDDSNLVRQDIIKNDMAARIIRLRPAVVVCRYYKRDFILDLFQKSLISAEDYKKLTLFLKENYTRKKLGEESYYIRNDRL
jgi:hypothetical protein